MYEPSTPRLHAELRESVERQLQALPVASGLEGSTMEEDGVIRNLQEQIQLSGQVIPIIMRTSYLNNIVSISLNLHIDVLLNAPSHLEEYILSPWYGFSHTSLFRRKTVLEG